MSERRGSVRPAPVSAAVFRRTLSGYRVMVGVRPSRGRYVDVDGCTRRQLHGGRGMAAAFERHGPRGARKRFCRRRDARRTSPVHGAPGRSRRTSASWPKTDLRGRHDFRGTRRRTDERTAPPHRNAGNYRTPGTGCAAVFIQTR